MKLNLRRKQSSPDRGWTKDNSWTIVGWAIGLLLVIFGMRDILHIPEWLAIPLGIILFLICLFVAKEFIPYL